MKKKLFIASVLILFTAVCMPLHSSDDQRYPPDIQRIKDRGKLVVAMFGQDIPPFFMHDEQGNFHGLDVKLARDIASRLGVDVEFNREAESFDEIINIVARKEADMGISWLSQTLERAEKVRFTEPYIVLRQGLLINRLQLAKLPQKDSVLQTLNHAQARIGVRSGTSYVDYAQNVFPQAQIQEYPDWAPYIVDAVFNGELVAGYHDEIEIKKYVVQRPEASIQASTAIIQDLTDPIAMAVPWDSPALLNWLNIYIQNHAGDWDADKLLQEYKDSL
ncbi:MAG: substrate-binding periplasmic protein [Thermodesulfobacteriota bacterium]